MFRVLCPHLFNWLVVEKQQTVEVADEDFENVTYHLMCKVCGKSLDLEHSRFIGGVDGFLERGRNSLKGKLSD